MTTGIYLLKFADGLEYVGQAIDIDKRWEAHKSNMLGNKAAAKMQQAFKKCGFPSFEVLDECHKDNLDILETFYIQLLRPALNTVLTGMYSNEELDIIERNKDLLHMSTTELLNVFSELRAAVNICTEKARALESAIEDLQNVNIEKESAIGAIRKLSLLKGQYEAEIDYLNEELHTAKSKLEWARKPWWKKLF